MAQVEPPPPRLLMRGISKRFGATIALDAVDLAVEAGEVHGLIGENGAGKSTLMKVLSGAVAPDAGWMALDGRPYRPRTPLEARRAGVAMIYQDLSLAPHLTVEDNIVLGMEPTRWGFLARREVRARARAALDQLGHGDLAPDALVGRLSISAQQIVEIARALAVGCRILVLDEPTSSLSQRDAEQLFALIRRLREQGLAIVYISHFLEEMRRVSDRFTVLRDGKVAGGGASADADIPEIIGMMVGRSIGQLYSRRSNRPMGEPILEVSDLAGARKPISATFTLHRGEILGICGLVGAGRTEMLRALFGLDPVRRGTIRLAAYVGPASPALRWAQGVGMVSEDRKSEGLALSLSVAHNITLSKLPPLVRPAWQDRAARKWMRDLDIHCRHPRQSVSELSGGNQQKVAVARLLQHPVDVFLLDEPTRGIDVASKAHIYALIEKMAAQGRAVLIVSSYLPELLGVCDRIAVMCRGRLGPPQPVDALNAHHLLLQATGGEAA